MSRKNYGPAVDPETREIRYLSPSQITTFDASQEGGCNRKWYFEKILGKRSPSTKSQELGEKIHSQLEHYLKTGEDGLGPEARAGKHLLPDPAPYLLVETAIEGETKPATDSPVTADGIPVIGRIDLAWFDMLGPYIRDHKTSSDRRYMKTPAQLATNVQMLAYGMWGGLTAQRTGMSSSSVSVGHIYYGTRSRWAEAVTVRLPFDSIQERWYGPITQTVKSMRAVARLPVITDVPANTAACGAYGGCPYRSECVTDPFEVLTMSLFSKPAEPTPETPRKLLIEDHSPARSTSDTITARPPTAGITPPDAVTTGITPPYAVTTGITPPDAPASDPILAAAGMDGQEHTSPIHGAMRWSAKDARWVAFAALAPSPIGSIPGPIGFVEAPAADSAPKKRGRPPKIKNPEPEIGPATVAAPPTPPPSDAALGGFILCIDAIPSTPYQSLDAYVAETHAAVCKAAGAIDFTAVEYGKGRGMLRAAAAARPPPAGTWVVFSGDVATPVIEGLTPLAAAVTRGVVRR